MRTKISLGLMGNEPRQEHLFSSLKAACEKTIRLPFDEIDLMSKYTAAALSLSWPRSEWWQNYQMHPIIQRRRKKVLLANLRNVQDEIDALLMWGSWFNPNPSKGRPLPFFNYIDQSYSLENLPGEKKGRFARRQRAHSMQTDCYLQSSKIFCMSKWARDQTLSSHDIDPGKVVAVGWGPCAIDLSSEPASFGGREPIVLHVSNDFKRKGVDYLIDTARLVREELPETRFVVIGKDNGSIDVSECADVEFLGPIYDPKQLSGYFRKASVFFMPHRFDRSPHVLVEAMSAGLPLVATAQGGAIELIDGTGTGLLCAGGDLVEYSNAILTLLRDDGKRSEMGQCGLQLSKTYYNWAAVARRIMSGIESVIKAY